MTSERDNSIPRRPGGADSCTPRSSGPHEGARAAAPSHISAQFADFLAQDTWADAPESCPSCGAEVKVDQARCGACGQWLARCSRSCASCASPTCVGGERAKR